MRRTGAALAACFVLAGCQTTAEQQANPPNWGRIDCQRPAQRPELRPLFEQAKLVCQERALAAAVAGTSSMPRGNGIGGAIASSIATRMTKEEIAVSTAKSCMAEYGFVLMTQPEHDQRCVALRAAMATDAAVGARLASTRSSRPARTGRTAAPQSGTAPAQAPSTASTSVTPAPTAPALPARP
jgi:hypothetical protein